MGYEIWGGLLGGIIGGIVGPLLVVLLLPRKKGPDCGAELTKLRNCRDTPGVVCRGCGCGTDVKGRKAQ
jgi:hypothetical protein